MKTGRLKPTKAVEVVVRCVGDRYFVTFTHDQMKKLGLRKGQRFKPLVQDGVIRLQLVTP